MDFIGIGQSNELPGKGPLRDDYAAHADSLAEICQALGEPGEAVLVPHEWGSALCFTRASPPRGDCGHLQYRGEYRVSPNGVA